MNKKWLLVSFWAVLCIASGKSYAYGLGFQFQTGPINFDPDVAQREGIEESGFGLGMDFYGIWLDYIRLGTGAYTSFVGDDAQYDVVVEDQYGNVSEAESTIGFTVLYVESGLTVKPVSRIRTDLLVGYNLFDKGVRSVNDCVDCPSDDLDIPVGAYVKPRISYIFHSDGTGEAGIGLEYTRYLGESGVENAIMLGIGIEGSF